MDNMSESRRLTDGYIGTYYSEESKGVYHFMFDEESGSMTEPELFYEAPGAKWVSLYENMLIFPIVRGEKAGTCFLVLEDGAVKSSCEILKEKHTPCYILQNGDYVYTANYHDGTVMIYHMEDGVPTIIKRIENGVEAGCHQILLHETFLLVPCLQQHRIRIFDMAHDFCPAGEITFPEGTGPRHGIFNKTHTKLYMVSEWSNELFIYQVNGRSFELVQSCPLLQDRVLAQISHGISEETSGGILAEASDSMPAGTSDGLSAHELQGKTAAAAVRLSEDERFLYVSLRGAELLAVINVSNEAPDMVQYAPCGGKHPRDFVLSRGNRYVLTANRMQGGIVCMERDSETGMLKEIKERINMPQGVSIALNCE